MAKQYLDSDGLLYFWQKIKNAFVPSTRTVNGKALSSNVTLKTSDLTNDSGYITSADIPEGSAASTTTPLMDGTAAVGTEMAFARGDHRHPSDTNKVDKVTGKGLSTNDYTTAEKNKLSGIASGAQVNVLEGVQVNGADLSITSKKVNVVVPIVSASVMPEYVQLGFSNSQSALVLCSGALGVANGVAQLDGNGKVPSSQLPSYVDDVIEAYARSGQTALSSTWLSTTSGGSALTPETGKIYILMADSGNYAANTQFRWSGSTYVKLADGGVSSITNAEIDTIVAS